MRRALVLPLAALLVAALLSEPTSASTLPGGDVGQVQATTERIRGLTALQPVPTVFLSRDEMRDTLLRDFDTDWFVNSAIRTQAAWSLLGLLPPDFDLRQSLIEAEGTDTLGFYSPKDHQIYLADDPTSSPVMRDMVLSHEFTHALQDQYFGLNIILPDPPVSNDSDLARRALVEGDAVLTMSSYAEQTFSPEELAALDTSAGELSGGGIEQLPAALRTEVKFPYEQGADFVVSMMTTGTINAAFRRPPSSTEQILHPSRYLRGEQPRGVGIPDLSAALGPGWRGLGGDVLGELDMRSMLSQQVSQGRAGIASEGWGGDRWELFQHSDGRQVLVLATIWDTLEDGHQFFDTFVAAQKVRYANAGTVTMEAPSEFEMVSPDGAWRVQAAGDQVLVLCAPDAATLLTLRAALADSPIQLG